MVDWSSVLMFILYVLGGFVGIGIMTRIDWNEDVRQCSSDRLDAEFLLMLASALLIVTATFGVCDIGYRWNDQCLRSH